MTSDPTDTLGHPNEKDESQPTEGSRLRQERDQAAKDRDMFRKEVLSMRLEKLGLNPEEGLGVAVMETYDGAPNQEALTAHLVEKYKYEVPVEVPAEKVTQPAERIAQVAENSKPTEMPQEPDPVAVANEKMTDPEAGREEAQESLAAKMQRYRQVRNQIQT